MRARFDIALGCNTSENGAGLAHLEDFQRVVSWHPAHTTRYFSRLDPCRPGKHCSVCRDPHALLSNTFNPSLARQRNAQPVISTRSCGTADALPAQRAALRCRAQRRSRSVLFRTCKMHQYLTMTGVHLRGLHQRDALPDPPPAPSHAHGTPKLPNADEDETLPWFRPIRYGRRCRFAGCCIRLVLSPD